MQLRTRNGPASPLRLRPPPGGDGSGHPLVVAAVVLLVFELLARGISPFLPPYSRWNFEPVDVKVAQMTSIARQEGSVDVIFLGNSVGQAGFDPSLFAERTGFRNAYNASLDGASARLLERWTLEVVVPLLRPRLVVIGLTSRDLNDNGRANASLYGKYMESEGRAVFLGRADFSERLEGWGARLSHLVRVRPFLRTPKELITQLGDHESAADKLGPRGEELLPPRPYDPGRLAEDIRREALNDYSVGGSEVAALEALVVALRQQGIAVVFVEMPLVEEDYVPLHPEGADDYERFRKTLRRLADRQGVWLLPADGFPQDIVLFDDVYHLNVRGAELLTERLAEELPAGIVPGSQS